MHAAPAPDSPRALLRRSLRWPAIVVVCCCAAVVALLASRYADTNQPGRVDRFIDTRMRAHFHQHDLLMRALRSLGNPESVIATGVVIVLVCLALHRYRAAVLTVVGFALAGGTVLVLKPLLDRRIHGALGGLSFPSGHTTGITAVAMVLVVFMFGHRHRQRALAYVPDVVIGLGLLAVVAGVATAMVVLKNHYFTDTVGGFATGIGAVLLAALVIDMVAGPAEPAETSAGSDAPAVAGSRDAT